VPEATACVEVGGGPLEHFSIGWKHPIEEELLWIQVLAPVLFVRILAIRTGQAPGSDG
jgi:hypothetical protein